MEIPEQLSDGDKEILRIAKESGRFEAIKYAKTLHSFTLNEATDYVIALTVKHNVIFAIPKVTTGAKVFAVVIILLFFWALKGCLFGGNDAKPETQAELAKKELQKHESMAKVIAKDFVSEKLNFPEEADFELLSTTVQYNDSALYNVRGYVTAKNAFGVKSKKSYNCFLHYLGGEDADTKSWELVALTFE